MENKISQNVYWKSNNKFNVIHYNKEKHRFVCSIRGSNPWPLAHKTNALPTELMERFIYLPCSESQPPTNKLVVIFAIQDNRNYTPTMVISPANIVTRSVVNVDLSNSLPLFCNPEQSPLTCWFDVASVSRNFVQNTLDSVADFWYVKWIWHSRFKSMSILLLMLALDQDLLVSWTFCRHTRDTSPDQSPWI